MSNSPKKLANKAIAIIKKTVAIGSNSLGRNFDACFEEGNGREVVIEFMKVYENDKELQRAVSQLKRYIAIEDWKDAHREHFKKYPSLFQIKPKIIGI